jgi:hypothetical protein
MLNIVTLGPEERPIESQRDEGWPKSDYIFARQPPSQPATQPADHLSYNRPYLGNQWSNLTRN